jgi:type I restriction enzyme S subunit
VTPRLRHLAEINPATPEFDKLRDDAEVTFLPLEAIWSDERYDPSRRRRKEEVSTGYTRFVEGDILLPKITPTFQADRVVIAKNIYSGVGTATTEVHVVRVGHRADTRYIRYLLSSKSFLDEGEASMIGVAGQKRVPDEYLRDLRVPVTEVLRQCAIADYLDTETARIDALIQKKRRMIELLDKHIATSISITTAAHTIQEHDTLPEDWRIVPLRRCFTSIDYGIGTASEATGKIAVLGMGNVDGGRIIGDPSGYVDEVDSWLLLQDSDLLFNRTNSLALVGKIAIWPGSDHPTTFASYLVRLRTGSLANARYLNYLLNSQEMLGFARAIALPSVGQANLNPSRYTSTHIPLPPLKTQQVIVDLLDSRRKVIDRATAALSRQLDLLVERRQALITATVAGELDIPGAAA